MGSLTIEEPLDLSGWNDLLRKLEAEDVSELEHLKLSTTGWSTFSWVANESVRIDGLAETIGELGVILGTGRFSALKSLKIDLDNIHWFEYLGLQSTSLAAAFRTGKFTNLRKLHLRMDEYSDIVDKGLEWSRKLFKQLVYGNRSEISEVFDALVEGGVSQLTSLSVQIWHGHPNVAGSFYALLKSLRNLRHLAIGFCSGDDEFTVFTEAIKSKLLPNITSVVFTNSDFRGELNLANLVEGAGILFSTLENLTLRNCCIISEQVCAMVEAIMKLTEPELALQVICLGSNDLGDEAIAALTRLVESGRLPHLQELDLSGNGASSGVALAKLMKAIQSGHLPALKKLDWRQNGVRGDDEGAEAIAQAYFENEALIADIYIDWDQLLDRSLEAKINEYKQRNGRLRALRNSLQDEINDLARLSSAKIFMCGYPEVGKTTLRKTLGRRLGFRTRFSLERRPKLLKEPRTRGIELSSIRHKDSITLIFWDLAGQEEFHVLHGTFLADLGFAGGKATTFVLVFRDPLEAEAKLMYWLKFVASSTVGHVKRHVVFVLNCFKGKPCQERDRRLCTSLIENFAKIFSDMLHIHPVPFIIDVRVAQQVQPLKDHLFNQAQALLQDIQVPKFCFQLLGDLKQWSETANKSHLPIFSWQAFEEGRKLKHHLPEDYSTENWKICASYLHEIGEIIYLDGRESTQPVSGNRGVVVPDPQWFCKEVVGQLLLPKHMLEGRKSVEVSADGSISVIWFEAFFKHLLPEGTETHDVISMLEQVGLSYRKNIEEIIMPALIRRDDYESIEWEGKGSNGVMGRCLATEDKGRNAIPGTLFRRLQVELARDPQLGGRGDSDYRAGKSYSCFKLGELLVLVQFDVDHSDPTDDRIDVLVKSVLNRNSTGVSLAKMNCICEIMQKLERLCVSCCPGLRYDVKAIQPWNAREKTPEMKDRVLMSLTEIKALLVKGREYSSWTISGDPVALKSFLSEGELKGVVATAERQYEECEREAVSLGLLTENPPQNLEEFEPETCNNAQALDMEGAVSKNQFEHRLDVSIPDIFLDIREQLHLTRTAVHDEGHLTRKVVHDEGHLTRQQIEKLHQELLVEIRGKHNVLVARIQAQQEFSCEERESSVPRYIFLSRRQGKSNLWITLKEAFNKPFDLHFLCESHFDDGFLHEVEGQEGIRLTSPKWLGTISPWLRWSLLVVIMVGKAVGNVYVPGVCKLIPDFDLLGMEKSGLSKAVDSAASMMLEEDKVVNRVEGDDGVYGTAAEPVNLKERMIAEGVVKDLIREIGEGAFRQKIGLRKVLLNAPSQPHRGHAHRSAAHSSVRWICDSCFKGYGDRAIA